MAHWQEWFPSKYIQATDLKDAAHPVIISHITMEEVGDEKTEKPVLHFQGQVKGLVLNKTNAKRIAALHGDDPQRWAGKGIIIYPTQVEFGGEEVDCVRVKKEAPVAAVTQQQEQPQQPTTEQPAPAQQQPGTTQF